MHATSNFAPEPPQTWRTLLVNTSLGVGTLAVATLGIDLFASHSGHIAATLPYLLLLACPLMHLFMHGVHGHHHGKRERPPKAGPHAAQLSPNRGSLWPRRLWPRPTKTRSALPSPISRKQRRCRSSPF